MGEKQSVEDFLNEKEGPPKKQVTAVVVGLGNRGEGYASYAVDFPSRLKIVAVAEPIQHRRAKACKKFQVAENAAFGDWKDLLKHSQDNGKLADCVIVATQDRMHKEPACAFAKEGYHILLEKPMAIEETDCEEIAKVCIENNIICAVCHVLRYFPPVIKIREIIDSGVLGDIITIDHWENIGYFHFAHSFVRGNWRNEAESTFSLLAKSCHDIDLIQYWMGNKKCIQVQSFGGVHHFRPEKKPQGAGKTCLECPTDIESACPYSALKIYKVDQDPPIKSPVWPAKVVCDIEDDPRGYNAVLKDALKEGPYGRCVYKCDNDVADHQVVNMLFEGGATASFTMNAFTPDVRRETRICGSLGELRWDGSANSQCCLILNMFNKVTRSTDSQSNHQIELNSRSIKPDMVAPPVQTGGHDGADFFLMNAFVKAVAEGKSQLVGDVTGVKGSLRSHKLVFAAEKSRKNNGKVINLNE